MNKPSYSKGDRVIVKKTALHKWMQGLVGTVKRVMHKKYLMHIEFDDSTKSCYLHPENLEPEQERN